MKNTKNIVIVIFILLLGFTVYSLSMSTKNNKTMDKQEKMNTEITDNNQMEDKDIQIEKKLSYMDLSVVDAKKLIDDNPELLIIDVSPNYAKGHIPGSINYYLGDESLAKAIPTLDKNKKYLVYCHADSASMAGAQMLIDNGFKNVYRLQGNYAAWVDAGYKIEK